MGRVQEGADGLRLNGVAPRLGVLERADACAHLARRAPLAKQERALTAWLNSHLAPAHLHSTPDAPAAAAPAGGDAAAAALLLQQRLSAQLQGVMWRQHRRDPQLAEGLKLPYAKVDAGVLSLSDVSRGNCERSLAI